MKKNLKDIIKLNVKPTSNQEELDIIVHYKNLKTKYLIMKNNNCASEDKLSKSFAVYKFECRDWQNHHKLMIVKSKSNHLNKGDSKSKLFGKW